MAQELNVGDVVELNSGGPKMTVVSIQQGGDARCTWLTPDGKQESGVFPKPRYALKARNSRTPARC